MAEPQTISEAIAQDALAGVQSSSVDGVSVTAMDIEKRIKADEYSRSVAARSRNDLGLSIRRMEPGGCG